MSQSRPPRFTIIVASFASLIAACIVYLGIDFERHRATPIAGQEVKMPDGTVLVLEQVSYGKQHAYSTKLSRPAFPFLDPARSASATAISRDDVMTFWMSRHGDFGEPLDFEWWLRTVAIDDDGCEWPDHSPGRSVFPIDGGVSSQSGSRPFSTQGTQNSGPVKQIIANSSIYPFRHARNSFRLRVIDLNNTPVAEFDVTDPSPTAGKYPVWQSEPLPITKSDGDLSVTLKRLTAVRSDRRGTTDAPPTVVQVNPEWTVAQNGAETSNWSRHSVNIVDATGRSGNQFDCPLCPGESAWKVQIRLFRLSRATFDETERWIISDIPVAASDKAVPLTDSTTIQELRMELAGSGGPGQATYFGLAPGYQGAWYSSGTVRSNGRDYPYQISTNSQSGSGTTVTCGLPHLVARVTGVDSDHTVPDLLIVDDQQRSIPVLEWTSNAGNTHFWFYDPPTDSKHLQLTFLAQKARLFEFSVKPPKIEPGGLFAHADELARHAKWADAAAEFSRGLAEYSENHWHWYRSLCLQAVLENRDEYQSQCRKMLDLFFDTDEPFIAERTAKSGLIWSGGATEDPRLIELSGRAVAKQPDSAWFVLVKGIGECRAKRFDSAVEWLTKVEKMPDTTQSSLCLARMFLAIAHFELGQFDVAKMTFESARSASDRTDLQPESADLGPDWHDRLMCQIVRREVEKLLGVKN